MIHFVLFFFKKQKLARVLEHYRYQVTIGRHWEQSSSSRPAEDHAHTGPTCHSCQTPSLSLSSSYSGVDWSSLNWWSIYMLLFSRHRMWVPYRSYSFLILTFLSNYIYLCESIINLPNTQNSEILKGYHIGSHAPTF